MASLNVLGLDRLLQDGLVELVLGADGVACWRLTPAGRLTWALLSEGRLG